MTDLRLTYLVANKDPLTETELRALILRVFAAHFCKEEGGETEVIQALTDALFEYRMAKAIKDDEDRKDGWETVVGDITGVDAERYYLDTCIAAYKDSGFDAKYAEESAMWPDVLPMKATWDKEMLQALALLEVGHDLMTMDVMREMHNRELKKTK
jgi:hypothetical protein